MKLTLQALYSQLTTDAAAQAAGLPKARLGGWRLSQHQVETLAAYRDAEVDVIFNTALTGDGKSLAAYLPMFVAPQAQGVLALYPTNELLADQEMRLGQYCQQFGVQERHGFTDAAHLTELMEKEEIAHRGSALHRAITRTPILLTNPDIFHLMMNFAYYMPGYRREFLLYLVQAHFDYFILDEFHIFLIPQIVSTINSINVMRARAGQNPGERRKFIFLSATPTGQIHDLLGRCGLRWREVKGVYSTTPGPNWRSILQEVELELTCSSAEAWCKKNLGRLVQVWREVGTAERRPKGLIVVNSVASARRIATFLKVHLPPDIRVGENTGLNDQRERHLARSAECDLVVGTSTIDVGVDFDINLLVFEATNAGTFLQRLGRLGRHPGFASYTAFGLISDKTPWVLERLTSGLSEGQVMDRQALADRVRAAYPWENEFRGYVRRWGSLQAAHVLHALSSPEVRANYIPQRAELAQTWGAMFADARGQPMKMGPQIRRYRTMWQDTGPKGQHHILQELLSFRGPTLTCGVWDITRDTFVTYDLLRIMASNRYEPLEEDEYLRQAERRGYKREQFKNARAFLRIEGLEDDVEHLTLHIKGSFYDLDLPEGEPLVLRGLRVKRPKQHWLSELNKIVSQQSFVCTMTSFTPPELRRKLKLPPLFGLIPLEDDRGVTKTVALGQQALLLDAVVQYLPQPSAPSIIV